MRAAVTFRTRTGERADGVVESRPDGALRLRPGTDAAAPRLDGVVTGAFTDAHVHLSLVPAGALVGGVLGRVVDLGGDPARLRTTAADAAAHRLQVEFAGAFLTAPGGYPTDRSWAAPGSYREVTGADRIRTAVAEMAAGGASMIKVASNSTAGPVFDDDDLAAVVAAAAAHHLPVVVHAEGPGEALRAARSGADLLAHAPFTETLGEDDLRMMARRTGWISTLDIHGWGEPDEQFAVAVENVRRFHAVGGRVVYGTDLGNGPLPAGLNTRELAALTQAGMTASDILRALTPRDPLDPQTPLVRIPGDPLRFSDAHPLTVHDLQEL